MRVARTISETHAFIKAARAEDRTIGLIPTMGAFHEGHLTLMRRARAEEDVVVVSLFVNPIQFGPGEDFAAYPRDFDSDARMASDEHVDLIFTPSPEEMYPRSPLTLVHVKELTSTLCGAFREGHFDGVTTVCNKLFNIIQPDRAYFGEKDYQQMQVIRRMVSDLNLPLQIVPVPTHREADGLAMSSRNRYLTEEERAAAPLLYQALQAAAQAARNGATGPQTEEVFRHLLAREPLFNVQYVQAVDPETLQPVTGTRCPMLIAAAAHLGKARLIDNITV